MFRRASILGTAALFAWTGLAAAGPGMLDLIPADAAAGFTVRNLNELRTKGDKFIAETGIKMPLRPSQLFDMAYQFLGVNNGLDGNGAAAVVLANPAAVGVDATNFRNLDQLLVFVVPFSDRDKMASNFGIKAGDLKPDKMVAGKGPNFGHFFYARGNHLFLGDNEKAVASVAKGKAIGGELAADRRKALAGADMLLHLGAKAWGDQWKQYLKSLEGSFGKAADKDEQEMVRQFIRSLEEVRYGFAAVRIDGGLGLSIMSVFPKEGNGSARKFLAALAGGPEPSRLTGLPEGRVVAAQALRGDGAHSALIAKVFLEFFLQSAVETKHLMSAADRPNFVGVFTEVWQRLQGSRVAVYQTGDEQQLGLFSLVAILDTEDPAKFLADLKELARMAEGKAVDLSRKGGSEGDAARIEQLVRDLGDKKFRVRQSATTRLGLLGEPALPFLEKAAKSGDLEVAMRAQRLRTQIQTVAAERRRELLAKDLPRHVRPAFTFVPKAEVRDGRPVNVVSVKLTGTDAAAAPQMRQLLGPDWDKVRLAVHGKHVVALLGSDVKLLDEALKNLTDGSSGLAGAKVLAGFHRQSNPAHKVEFHVSLQRVLALITAPQPNQLPAKPDWSLTSFALAVEPDRVQLDVWLPSPEFKAVVKKNGWW